MGLWGRRVGKGGLCVAGFLWGGGPAVDSLGLVDLASVGIGTGGFKVVILLWSASGTLVFGGIFPGLGGSMITLGIAVH